MLLGSQDIFLDLLDKADEELGFKTQDYKLMIEALATSEGNFILTVTRMKPEVTVYKGKSPKVSAKRKLVKPNLNLAIYKFNNFDDFIDFTKYIDRNDSLNKVVGLKNSSLYLYNKNYYLVFNNLKISNEIFKALACGISEFSTYVQDTLFERKLKEYGKIIMKKNAIQTGLKFFK